MSIQISERAIARIKAAAESEGVTFDSSMLRVAVVPGGCSGLTYDLGWDTTEQAGDEVSEVEGIRVVMDKRSRLYVDGSKLDFTEGLEGKGFHFANPQASRTCACGESFGL
jgi:iron-sulfur cluster assembly protein